MSLKSKNTMISLNALKNELADVEENIRVKQAVLQITDQALTEVT